MSQAARSSASSAEPRWTWWKHRTKTGRVIYDRKKHPFSWRDVLRILYQVPMDDDQWRRWWLLVLINLLKRYDRWILDVHKERLQLLLAVILDDYEAHDDLSWGTRASGFGGAGATREIPEAELEEAAKPGATRAYGESPFRLGPCGVPWFLMPIQLCEPK